MNKHSGFTLVEMMATVAIMAVVLAVGVPSFQSITKGNRLVAHTNDLLNALNFSRSEAIKRGQRVAICRTLNNNNVCQTDWTNSWEKGWMVFVDLNNNGTRDTGETILGVHGPFDYGVSGGDTIGYVAAALNGSAITDGSFRNFIVYSPDGAVRALNGQIASGSLFFSLCYKHLTNAILVNFVGRAGIRKNVC
ncbi:type IV fimbrial biogenesis protein FimT [Gammaproteobacteria bacterium]